jgi:hypothetical protein
MLFITYPWMKRSDEVGIFGHFVYIHFDGRQFECQHRNVGSTYQTSKVPCMRRTSFLCRFQVRNLQVANLTELILELSSSGVDKFCI